MHREKTMKYVQKGYEEGICFHDTGVEKRFEYATALTFLASLIIRKPLASNWEHISFRHIFRKEETGLSQFKKMHLHMIHQINYKEETRSQCQMPMKTDNTNLTLGDWWRVLLNRMPTIFFYLAIPENMFNSLSFHNQGTNLVKLLARQVFVGNP